VAFKTLTPPMFDYDLRLTDMDRFGVDVAVVSLIIPTFTGAPKPKARRSAQHERSYVCRSAGASRRLRYLASLPWQYPERACVELERACRDGAVGVMVLANVAGESLVDPRFAEVWRSIDERGLPVLLHPAVPPAVDQLNMSRYHLVWNVGFIFDTTLALSTMIWMVSSIDIRT